MSATQYRPWGYFNILSNDLTKDPQYQVKRLVINPGKQFSLQTHEQREEYWLIVEGEGVVRIANKMLPANVRDTFFIPKQTLHRAKNTSTLEKLVIIETQMGTYLGEDDIKRYEDDFGRVEAYNGQKA